MTALSGGTSRRLVVESHSQVGGFSAVMNQSIALMLRRQRKLRTLSVRSVTPVPCVMLVNANGGDNAIGRRSSSGTGLKIIGSRPPSDFDHTALVNERIADWAVGGYAVDVEAQNRFELRGRTATLAGRPDLVVLDDRDATIIDVKTGQERPWHRVQGMIYQ